MIAVVEDEKELCESLKMLLTEKGYEMYCQKSRFMSIIMVLMRFIASKMAPRLS